MIIGNVILDAPIIFSAFVFFINGWKKGVVRPFMNFVGGIIAFAASGIISFHISFFVHDNFLKPIIINKFNEYLSTNDINLFPKYLLTLLGLCGVESFKISQIIGRFDAGELLFRMVSPYVLNAVRLLIGSFLFGVMIFISKKISKSSCDAFKVPILAQFNSFLGAFFGLLKGLFIIWGVVLFLKIVLIYWSEPPKIFSQGTINSTSIFVKFYDFNPISNSFVSKIPFIENMDISRYLI